MVSASMRSGVQGFLIITARRVHQPRLHLGLAFRHGGEAWGARVSGPAGRLDGGRMAVQSWRMVSGAGSRWEIAAFAAMSPGRTMPGTTTRAFIPRSRN